MNELVYILHYTHVKKAAFLGACFLSAINKLLDILPEVLIGMAVDTVVNKHDSFIAHFGISSTMTQLTVLALITLVAWFLESLTEYAHLRAWKLLAQSIQHELRVRAYEHVQRQEIGYFEDKSSGELASILTDDIHQLERFFDGGANSIIHFIVSTIAIGMIFLYLAPLAAVCTFVPVPFIIMMAISFQKKISNYFRSIRYKSGLLVSQIANSIAGIVTVKSYGAEGYEIERLKRTSADYQASYTDLIRLSSSFTPVIRMIIVTGFIGALLVGGWYVTQGTLAVGAYSILIFLTQRFLWPFVRYGELLELYERTKASAGRILTILKVPVISEQGLPALAHVDGEIKFCAVTFSYPQGNTVLHDLSFTVPAGATAAFVGETGSGKSTIVKLLLRFYPLNHGNICIDDVDICTYTPHALRSVCGFISQEVFIINGTVAENIAYGMPSTSFEKIEEAARAAQAYDFIVKLPQGFATIIGEYGYKLSGGQRQRISIARALLKNPYIFIFDEAMSAIDNETEQAIQCALHSAFRNRTTLVIAHRLTTVRNANIIFVLDKGKIVERGNHNELLSLNGVYSRLWHLQTGSLIDCQ